MSALRTYQVEFSPVGRKGPGMAYTVRAQDRLSAVAWAKQLLARDEPGQRYKLNASMESTS